MPRRRSRSRSRSRSRRNAPRRRSRSRRSTRSKRRSRLSGGIRSRCTGTRKKACNKLEECVYAKKKGCRSVGGPITWSRAAGRQSKSRSRSRSRSRGRSRGRQPRSRCTKTKKEQCNSYDECVYVKNRGCRQVGGKAPASYKRRTPKKRSRAAPKRAAPARQSRGPKTMSEVYKIFEKLYINRLKSLIDDDEWDAEDAKFRARSVFHHGVSFAEKRRWKRGGLIKLASQRRYSGTDHQRYDDDPGWIEDEEDEEDEEDDE
jgi:hypothetical protein